MLARLAIAAECAARPVDQAPRHVFRDSVYVDLAGRGRIYEDTPPPVDSGTYRNALSAAVENENLANIAFLVRQLDASMCDALFHEFAFAVSSLRFKAADALVPRMGVLCRDTAPARVGAFAADLRRNLAFPQLSYFDRPSMD